MGFFPVFFSLAFRAASFSSYFCFSLAKRSTALLYLGLGRSNGFEPRFPTCQFLEDVLAFGQIFLVGLPGFAQQLCDFTLELLFQLAGVAPIQSMVLRCITFNLGAVSADASQFQDPHLMGDQQDLGKQCLEFFEKSLAE